MPVRRDVAEGTQDDRTREERMRPRALAVFAHPDDETFLAGSTLARLAECGVDVRVLCLTRGEAGRRGDYEALSPEAFGELRQQELEAACQTLGIRRPILGGCRDGAVATECRALAERGIAGVLQTLRPELVITFGPDGVSGHPDHVAVSEITTAAFHHAFPAVAADAPESRLYYVLRSGATPNCCRPAVARSIPPLTTVIDAAAVGAKKLEAVRCHRSQRHLQPAEPTARAAILSAPEHFHRALPPWRGGPVETRLEDLVPALRCRPRARRRRPVVGAGAAGGRARREDR
jgi:LmbE family N-acetylglucosaminyl deacetylase